MPRESAWRDTVSRAKLPQLWMNLALAVRELSTCRRSQVGCVITTADFEQVLGVGYNGNAMGLANTCDLDEVGNCGCIHAEVNALIKVGAGRRDKVIFTTMGPCLACAKLILNSGCSKLRYYAPYRDSSGLALLDEVGIDVRPV